MHQRSALSTQKHTHRPKKSLGQNFLIDQGFIQKIVNACQIQKTDTIFEIGAGQGALTQSLSQLAYKVIAVETDRQLVENLRLKFNNTNVEIIHADILKFDLKNLPGRCKAIGNLPYNIASLIIAKFLEEKNNCRDLFFTVQKEFAQRICASPNSKEIGAFTHFVQYFSRPQILFKIPSGCFKPQPKVDSCFLEIRIPEQPTVSVQNQQLLFEIIRKAFQQRRKTLLNALSNHTPKEKLLTALNDLKINPQTRCETLSLEDFCRLTDRLLQD